VALGDPNVAMGTGAVAIGANNTALGDGSVAIGNISSAVGFGSLALGNNAIANNAGDVALGAGSVSAGPNPTAGVSLLGTNYAFAGANPNSVVSVGAPGAERQITNVAAGAITSTSTQAVNGSELYATNQAVTVLGSEVSSVGTGSGSGGLSALAAQVSSNTAATAALSSGVSSGLLGLVQQQGGAPGTGAITVGAQTGGTSVNIAGTSGARVLSGVAPGVAATDAVDVGQLQSALGGATANAVQYDNASHSSVTLGGTGASAPVALNNVAAGALSATSTAAVNGSQLYAANTNITNLQNGAAGPFQVYQSGTVTAPIASGLQSTAGGDGAIATGGASTAIGYRATASGVNSVALGANSSDGGQSSVVSVGSPGNERRITNLAPGVAGTDAANINQLNAISNYAASLNNALSIRLSQAVAGGAALSSIPTSVIPDKGMFGMAYGQYGDSFAVGIGASKVFNDRFNTTFRVGVTFSVDGGSVTSGAGIGWHF
jgi:autotransporter adhesin